MTPPESNFSSFLYHTPAPNFPLGDDCPFLLFHFSYFSRLTFLNIFNCIISQFPVIQQTHSKFLKVGTNGPLLCQHHLPLGTYSVHMNHYSLISDPVSPLGLLLMLLSATTLCFRITLPVETLPLFGDMFWTYFFIHLFLFGV